MFVTFHLRLYLTRQSWNGHLLLVFEFLVVDATDSFTFLKLFLPFYAPTRFVRHEPDETKMVNGQVHVPISQLQGICAIHCRYPDYYGTSTKFVIYSSQPAREYNVSTYNFIRTISRAYDTTPRHIL